MIARSPAENKPPTDGRLLPAGMDATPDMHPTQTVQTAVSGVCKHGCKRSCLQQIGPKSAHLFTP
jgi:hypothetical protein